MTKQCETLQDCKDFIENKIEEHNNGDNRQVMLELVALHMGDDSNPTIKTSGRLHATVKATNIRLGWDRRICESFPVFFNLDNSIACLWSDISKAAWKLDSDIRWCDNLGLMTKSELDLVAELFVKLRESNITFELGVLTRPMVNTVLQKAFFVQQEDNYRSWGINPNTDKLEEMYNCGECGEEGFVSECTKECCKEYCYE